MKSKKLYITMSIFIIVMVGGGTFVSVYWEDIKIRYYIWKLDSKDKQEEAIDWLEIKASERKPDDLIWDTLIAFQIRKLDSKTKAEKKKAFDWLKKLAEENIDDSRLKAFFKHPESLKQVKTRWNEPSLILGNFDLVNVWIMLEQYENIKDNDGMTPLHWVALMGIDKLAQLLLKQGANVNAKTNAGETPLDCAESSSIFFSVPHNKDRKTTAALLRNHGAKTGAELKEFQEKKKKK